MFSFIIHIFIIKTVSMIVSLLWWAGLGLVTENGPTGNFAAMWLNSSMRAHGDVAIEFWWPDTDWTGDRIRSDRIKFMHDQLASAVPCNYISKFGYCHRLITLCCLSVICLSVTRVYCDKTTETRIMQFLYKK